MGYVGLSLAVLLAQHNEVVAFDIDERKVDLVANRKSPICDSKIEQFLKDNTDLRLSATTDSVLAYRGAQFVVVATPTDYDSSRGYFDTSSVESAIWDWDWDCLVLVDRWILGFVPRERKACYAEECL